MAEVVAEVPQTIADEEMTAMEDNVDKDTEEALNNATEVEQISEQNGDAKRSRVEEDNGTDVESGVASKKQKVENSIEEEQPGKLQQSEEEKDGAKEGEGEEEVKKSDHVCLGPKNFSSSVEMFDYFHKFLHYWPPNLDVNKYEYMVLLDLLKKGCMEPEKKIGGGIHSFQVRYHPMWKSRCFFLVRQDESVDDFSFRKCVDHILPLPEEMKLKPDANKALGGRGGRGGGRGGRGGGRGGRGGHGRGRGGWSRK